MSDLVGCFFVTVLILAGIVGMLLTFAWLVILPVIGLMKVLGYL